MRRGIIKMMEEKNITIDDLAIMIQKGFDGADLRFDKVDGRLDKVENRLETIEKRH